MEYDDGEQVVLEPRLQNRIVTGFMLAEMLAFEKVGLEELFADVSTEGEA